MTTNQVSAGLLMITLFSAAAVSASEEQARDCMDCHGEAGVSTETDVPTIAGYSAQYIIDTMIAYAEGDRPAPESKYRHGDTGRAATDMAAVAKALDEEQTESVAGYFAEQKFVPAKQDFDTGKAATGEKLHAKHCKKCHEDGGSSPEDDAGILAGQWMPYLKQVFADYSSGERWMPKKMAPKMKKLDAAGTEALIHYYGSLQ